MHLDYGDCQFCQSQPAQSGLLDKEVKHAYGSSIEWSPMDPLYAMVEALYKSARASPTVALSSLYQSKNPYVVLVALPWFGRLLHHFPYCRRLVLIVSNFRAVGIQTGCPRGDIPI